MQAIAHNGLYIYHRKERNFFVFIFIFVVGFKNDKFIYCRYLGFKKSILLDRKRLVELLDLHQNGTLLWNDFAGAVRSTHEKRMGQPTRRVVIPDRPKEEDYFYANPQECLCEESKCDDSFTADNLSKIA